MPEPAIPRGCERRVKGTSLASGFIAPGRRKKSGGGRPLGREPKQQPEAALDRSGHTGPAGLSKKPKAARMAAAHLCGRDAAPQSHQGLEGFSRFDRSEAKHRKARPARETPRIQKAPDVSAVRAMQRLGRAGGLEAIRCVGPLQVCCDRLRALDTPSCALDRRRLAHVLLCAARNSLGETC